MNQGVESADLFLSMKFFISHTVHYNICLNKIQFFLSKAQRKFSWFIYITKGWIYWKSNQKHFTNFSFMWFTRFFMFRIFFCHTQMFVWKCTGKKRLMHLLMSFVWLYGYLWCRNENRLEKSVLIRRNVYKFWFFTVSLWSGEKGELKKFFFMI